MDSDRYHCNERREESERKGGQRRRRRRKRAYAVLEVLPGQLRVVGVAQKDLAELEVGARLDARGGPEREHRLEASYAAADVGRAGRAERLRQPQQRDVPRVRGTRHAACYVAFIPTA